MPEDPRMLAEHLAEAERHVHLGERHMLRQRELIDELQRDGHDSTTARRLLDTYEKVLMAHIAQRDCIRRELSPPSGGQA